MKTIIRCLVAPSLLLLTAALTGSAGAGRPGADAAALRALVPGERDLPGFSQVRPADEVPPTTGRRVGAHPIADEIRLNAARGPEGARRPGLTSRIDRGLYSADTFYFLGVEVVVCDSQETARDEAAQKMRTQALWRPGSPRGGAAVGDESWVPELPDPHDLLVRAGNTVVVARAMPSNLARRSGTQVRLPPACREAVAHSVLVRLSRQPELTGVTATHPPVAVMGKALPQDDAVEIAGRIYVRTGAAMAAAGWKHEWDAKTGVLVLRHSAWTQKTIALRALPAKGAENITVPLWSDGGQPMMLLTDLAATLKASMSRDAQGVYQVRGL